MLFRSTVSGIDRNFTLEQFHAQNARIMNTGGLTFETVQTAKDGHAVPVEMRVSYVPDGKNGGDQIIAFCRDISDRKRLEHDLQEAAERVQQALRVSRSFTFEWTMATDSVFRSASCANILKLTGEEAVQDTGQNYFQRIVLEDRNRFAQLLQGLSPASSAYETTYKLKCGDGSIVALEEVGRGQFDATGRLLRVIGVTSDVSTHMQALEELTASKAKVEQLAEEQKAILDSPVVGIALIENRRMSWVNQTFATLLGYHPEELIQQSTRMIYPTEAAFNEEKRGAYPVIHAGKTFRTEITLACKDGRDRKSTRLNSSHSQQSRMPSSA